MTPKEQYEERRRLHKERMMEENRKADARQQREELTDVAITKMLEGMKSFFEGHASIDIVDPMGVTTRIFFRAPRAS